MKTRMSTLVKVRHRYSEEGTEKTYPNREDYGRIGLESSLWYEYRRIQNLLRGIKIIIMPEYLQSNPQQSAGGLFTNFRMFQQKT